jgi:hypothetical protein
MIFGSTIGGVNTRHVRQAEEFAELRLPGGRKVRDVSEAELYRLLEKMLVPGFGHTNPRNANLELYEKHLNEIAQAAADAAIAHYLDQQK